MRTLLFLCVVVSVLITAPLMAQNPAETVEMADNFREDGKIYVVVAVVCAILVGIFVYLIGIDRKVSKLEKEIKK